MFVPLEMMPLGLNFNVSIVGYYLRGTVMLNLLVLGQNWVKKSKIGNLAHMYNIPDNSMR